MAVCDLPSDDPRLGDLLGRKLKDADEAHVVLVGFPSDEGVRINGGRPGAAQAPAAIRTALHKLTPDARCFDAFVDLLTHTADLGDIPVTGDVEQDQEGLGQTIAPHLQRGAVPIILGGGHETAYGHFLGHVEAEAPVTILNWDAHADVRPRKDGRPHSGSSFRLALEHSSGCCRGYTVAGLQPQSTAQTHLQYIEERSGTAHWRSDVDSELIHQTYETLDAPCLVTFDLDAVDQSLTPGVSAPAVGGFTTAEWLEAAEGAGRCPQVRSIDVSECNPRFDVDGRTARLAALTVWHVLRGLAVAQRLPGR